MSASRAALFASATASCLLAVPLAWTQQSNHELAPFRICASIAASAERLECFDNATSGVPPNERFAAQSAAPPASSVSDSSVAAREWVGGLLESAIRIGGTRALRNLGAKVDQQTRDRVLEKFYGGIASMRADETDDWTKMRGRIAGFCFGEVKERLKRPSTARFADLREQRIRVSDVPNRYVLYSTYDTENEAGVMIRGSFMCETDYDPVADKISLAADGGSYVELEPLVGHGTIKFYDQEDVSATYFFDRKQAMGSTIPGQADRDLCGVCSSGLTKASLTRVTGDITLAEERTIRAGVSVSVVLEDGGIVEVVTQRELVPHHSGRGPSRLNWTIRVVDGSGFPD